MLKLLEKEVTEGFGNWRDRPPRGRGEPRRSHSPLTAPQVPRGSSQNPSRALRRYRQSSSKATGRASEPQDPQPWKRAKFGGLCHPVLQFPVQPSEPSRVGAGAGPGGPDATQTRAADSGKGAEAVHGKRAVFSSNGVGTMDRDPKSHLTQKVTENGS